MLRPLSTFFFLSIYMYMDKDYLRTLHDALIHWLDILDTGDTTTDITDDIRLILTTPRGMDALLASTMLPIVDADRAWQWLWSGGESAADIALRLMRRGRADRTRMETAMAHLSPIAAGDGAVSQDAAMLLTVMAWTTHDQISTVRWAHRAGSRPLATALIWAAAHEVWPDTAD